MLPPEKPPKATAQQTRAWTSKTMSQNKPFLILSWLSWVFCHIGRQLRLFCFFKTQASGMQIVLLITTEQFSVIISLSFLSGFFLQDSRCRSVWYLMLSQSSEALVIVLHFSKLGHLSGLLSSAAVCISALSSALSSSTTELVTTLTVFFNFEAVYYSYHFFVSPFCGVSFWYFGGFFFRHTSNQLFEYIWNHIDDLRILVSPISFLFPLSLHSLFVLVALCVLCCC